MKWAAWACVVLAVLVLAGWLAGGAAFVTRYQLPVEVTVVDDFGDEMTTTRMQDGFELGLMPAHHVDGALPISVGLGVCGGIFFMIHRRRRNG